jgi:hypothetical protein
MKPIVPTEEFSELFDDVGSSVWCVDDIPALSALSSVGITAETKLKNVSDKAFFYAFNGVSYVVVDSGETITAGSLPPKIVLKVIQPGGSFKVLNEQGYVANVSVADGDCLTNPSSKPVSVFYVSESVPLTYSIFFDNFNNIFLNQLVIEPHQSIVVGKDLPKTPALELLRKGQLVHQHNYIHDVACLPIYVKRFLGYCGWKLVGVIKVDHTDYPLHAEVKKVHGGMLPTLTDVQTSLDGLLPKEKRVKLELVV